jgi:hypothetical protein
VYGRAKGIESLNHHCQIKCVTIKLDRPSARHGVPTDGKADEPNKEHSQSNGGRQHGATNWFARTAQIANTDAHK